MWLRFGPRARCDRGRDARDARARAPASQAVCDLSQRPPLTVTLEQTRFEGDTYGANRMEAGGCAISRLHWPPPTVRRINDLDQMRRTLVGTWVAERCRRNDSRGPPHWILALCPDVDLRDRLHGDGPTRR